MARTFVIVNQDGEFFCGDWANIKWTAEYPNARTYKHISIAENETRKLRVEVLAGGTVQLVEDYGLDTERWVTP